jgi:hypothetical protein
MLAKPHEYFGAVVRRAQEQGSGQTLFFDPDENQ